MASRSRQQDWKCPKCEDRYHSPIRLTEVVCRNRRHGTETIRMELIEGNPLESDVKIVGGLAVNKKGKK